MTNQEQETVQQILENHKNSSAPALQSDKHCTCTAAHMSTHNACCPACWEKLLSSHQS